MPKYSVKKPYTVLVAVVIVVVLGFVSFSSMTPDLLPNIDLPYIIIITAYPGATPERVETTVTRPLEQAMATLDKIETISSTSSENSSMIMLEFTSDVNMDTITVDILQSITQVQGYWDDTVGTPYILKLNPNMLPVMVTAVQMEGMETPELSTFLDETLLNRLEGITGVASVSGEGLVEQNVEVAFNQDKIRSTNARIRRGVDAQFADAEQELDDALEEVEDNLSEIESGMEQLQSAIEELAGQMAFAQSEMTSKQLEILEGKLMIYQQMAALEESRAQLEQLESLLLSLQSAITNFQIEIDKLTGEIEFYEAIQQEIAALDAAQAALENQPPPASTEGESEQTQEITPGAPATDEQYQLILARQAEIDAQLAARGVTREDLPSQIERLRAALEELNISLQNAESTLSDLGLDLSMLDDTINELADGKKQIDDGLALMQGLLADIDSGKILLSQAMQELDKQKTIGILKMSETTTQLLLGEATLNMALEQIESGLDQLEEAKEDAYDQSDLQEILTLDMVSNILVAQNFSMPAGYVTQDGINYLVRVGDAFSSIDEIEKLLLIDLQMEDIDPIYLRDVADIRMVDNTDEIYAKINGTDGVLLTFMKQSTYATAEVSNNLQAEFEELTEQYEGLSFTTLMDQGDYIYLVVNSVLQNLLMGAAFAVVVLFIFLRDVKPTAIILFSIPTSLLFAITLMYFSGITLNIISLSGLAIAVGMLVDNSVVVIENIYRLRSLGEPVVKAAVSGAQQVGGAIAASTLTTVCVFMPIVFVQGLTRQLFTDMALTLAYSLLASLIVALTLVPAMSASVLKTIKPYEGKWFTRMMKGYEFAVGWALDHRLPVLLSSVALLVISGVLTVIRGFSFMPEMNMPELNVSIEMPEGSEMDDTRKMADAVAQRLQELEEVDTVGAMVSSGGLYGLGGGAANTTSVTIYVQLDPDTKRTSTELIGEIDEMFVGYDAEITASSSSIMSSGAGLLGGSGVTIDLYGENLDDLRETAKDVAAALENVSGTINVQDGIGDTNPEIRFIVDRDKAMAKGLTTAQVFMELSEALTTEKTATTLTSEGDDYSVLVVTGDEDKLTPAYMRNYSFTVTKQDGEKETIRIRDIADIVETETQVSIGRSEQKRYITVSAEIETGYNVTLVTNAAQSMMEGKTLPTGITYEFTGENETIMEAFVELGKMLLLGVLLVYLIMVAQFQSLISPFIVMFTIPLAFTGGLLALFMTGMELSVIALIGFVMLTGIIVNNGIVLVEYIDQMRLEGTERREAIIQSGITRMRPILMTTITTVVGLFQMALGIGQGAELMQPLAIVCVGGLTYATILTLFVIPVIYDMLSRKEMRVIKDEDLVISDK